MGEKQFQGWTKKARGRDKYHFLEIGVEVYENGERRSECFSSIVKLKKTIKGIPLAFVTFSDFSRSKNDYIRKWFAVSRYGKLSKYHSREQFRKMMVELEYPNITERQALRIAAEKIEELRQKGEEPVIQDTICPVCGEKLEYQWIFYSGIAKEPLVSYAGCENNHSGFGYDDKGEMDKTHRDKQVMAPLIFDNKKNCFKTLSIKQLKR